MVNEREEVRQIWREAARLCPSPFMALAALWLTAPMMWRITLARVAELRKYA